MNTRSQYVNTTAATLAWLMALAVAAVFVWLLGDLVQLGLPALSWSFLHELPRDAGRAGGILPLLVATLWILGICLLAAVPLGLATAVTLTEYLPRNGLGRRLLSRSLDVLSGVPSIVFGLFGYAVFAIKLGMGFSILSGGLTLACMVLPLFVRVTEQSLLMSPAAFRQAAQSLGISRTGWILRILLPSAIPGILAGLILSIGRALAETAALVFTSGYVMRMPASAFDSGRALSVHIYDLSMNVSGGNHNAAATALVLILLLLTINASAGLLARRLTR